VLAACATGCTAHIAQPATETPIASRSPEVPVLALPPLSLPTNETVLVALENQHGLTTRGPYRRTTDSIAVYFNCAGAGTATVSIDGVGSFPLACGPSGAEGVKNVFDVRYVDTVRLEVDAPDTALWSLGVTGDSGAIPSS
jgi:hypothetical protein